MPRSDVVRDAVERAIMSFDPIRTGDTDIEVVAENGTVALLGYVRSRTMKTLAGQLAAPLLDGRALRNDLVSDDDLEIVIATAIETAGEGYLAPAPLQVRVLRGHCVLRGTVPSEDAKEEIERLARAVPGVLHVANALEVDPVAIERLLAPKKAAGRKKGRGGGAKEAMVGGKPVTAADLPAWALKAKEQWEMADYKERAKAKMAFKRGEGPDPKELEEAGAILAGGAELPTDEVDDVTTLAEAEEVVTIPAGRPELMQVPAAAETPPALATDTPPLIPIDSGALPAWALKPKEQWDKTDFQAHAKAKSAFKKGEGPDPDELIAQGQAAAAAAPPAGAAAGAPVVDVAALEAKYPSWALKPKEEWSPDDFKAQAKAKSAFKKGEGPDPEALIAEAQGALQAAKAPAMPVGNGATRPRDSAAAALEAVRARYPGWALKPRPQWTAQDFREAAEAKVAEIHGRGPAVTTVRIEAQEALEAAKRGEVSDGGAARAVKRELTPEEIEQVRAALSDQFPVWALKPKEEWSKDDFKAQAAAKSAAKKGEGDDPAVIIERAQAAFEEAKAKALAAAPAVEAAPAAATAPAGPREIPPELLDRYPSWALKPKDDWSPAEFKAHAKAKSAFKKGEGPDPDALTTEAQAALGA